MAIYKLEENTPEIAETAWVAESAVVVGKVKLEEHASVWFNVSIRGDNGWWRRCTSRWVGVFR